MAIEEATVVATLLFKMVLHCSYYNWLLQASGNIVPRPSLGGEGPETDNA